MGTSEELGDPPTHGYEVRCNGRWAVPGVHAAVAEATPVSEVITCRQLRTGMVAR